LVTVVTGKKQQVPHNSTGPVKPCPHYCEVGDSDRFWWLYNAKYTIIAVFGSYSCKGGQGFTGLLAYCSRWLKVLAGNTASHLASLRCVLA